MGTVWTEVLNAGVAVTWAWDGANLLALPYPLEGYTIGTDTIEAIGRYADDKEFDMLINEAYDESDFDGTLEEFVREELAGCTLER